MEEMRRSRIHLSCVSDGGTLLGLLSLADILQILVADQAS